MRSSEQNSVSTFASDSSIGLVAPLSIRNCGGTRQNGLQLHHW